MLILWLVKKCIATDSLIGLKNTSFLEFFSNRDIGINSDPFSNMNPLNSPSSCLFLLVLARMYLCHLMAKIGIEFSDFTNRKLFLWRCLCSITVLGLVLCTTVKIQAMFWTVSVLLRLQRGRSVQVIADRQRMTCCLSQRVTRDCSADNMCSFTLPDWMLTWVPVRYTVYSSVLGCRAREEVGRLWISNDELLHHAGLCQHDAPPPPWPTGQRHLIRPSLDPPGCSRAPSL